MHPKFIGYKPNNITREVSIQIFFYFLDIRILTKLDKNCRNTIEVHISQFVAYRLGRLEKEDLKILTLFVLSFLYNLLALYEYTC